jgi:hypothetical protein
MGLKQTFLAKTFLERGNGFHFSVTPPKDISETKYLTSDDIEEILGCVLANLQQGRFDVAKVPLQLLQSRDRPGLWLACTHLLGYAAPMHVVRGFVADCKSLNNIRQFYICNSGMAAGGLWSVEPLLADYSYVTDPDVRQFFEFCLSWLLEGEPGVIWKGPTLMELTGDVMPPFEERAVQRDVDSYREIIRSQRAELVKNASLRDDSVIAEGEVFHIGHVALRLLNRVRRGEPGDRIEKGRMLFEATTGIDCRVFFNENGRLQPLPAAAILEDFLDSQEADKYEPGVRYFFGHRIPD